MKKYFPTTYITFYYLFMNKFPFTGQQNKWIKTEYVDILFRKNSSHISYRTIIIIMSKRKKENGIYTTIYDNGREEFFTTYRKFWLLRFFLICFKEQKAHSRSFYVIQVPILCVCVSFCVNIHNSLPFYIMVVLKITLLVF